MILKHVVKINILINFFFLCIHFFYTYCIYAKKKTRLKNLEKTILNNYKNHYKNIKIPN